MSVAWNGTEGDDAGYSAGADFNIYYDVSLPVSPSPTPRPPPAEPR